MQGLGCPPESQAPMLEREEGKGRRRERERGRRGGDTERQRLGDRDLAVMTGTFIFKAVCATFGGG